MKRSFCTAFVCMVAPISASAPDEYAALTMVLLRLLAFKPAQGEAEKKTLKTAAQPAIPAPESPRPSPTESPSSSV
jgi:DNA polymerase-3 subunit gamma/tau